MLCKLAAAFTSCARLCPIFQLSNTTGEGLDFVRAVIVDVLVRFLTVPRAGSDIP